MTDHDLEQIRAILQNALAPVLADLAADTLFNQLQPGRLRSPSVTEVKVGDRVAYAGGPIGAYAEERINAGRSSHCTARQHLRRQGH